MGNFIAIGQGKKTLLRRLKNIDMVSEKPYRNTLINARKKAKPNSEKLLHFDLKERDTKMNSSQTAPLNLHLHLQSHLCTGRLKPPYATFFFSSN